LTLVKEKFIEIKDLKIDEKIEPRLHRLEQLKAKYPSYRSLNKMTILIFELEQALEKGGDVIRLYEEIAAEEDSLIKDIVLRLKESALRST